MDLFLSKLKAEHGLRILSTTSDKAEAHEVESGTSSYCEIAASGVFAFGQYYLVSSTEAKTPMWYAEESGKWHIDSEQSEVVQLSTCDYGRGVLSEGRLYFQKDMLSPSKDALVPKSADFVKWAEAIFRTSKKQFRYCQEVEAYVGPYADVWRKEGGKFVLSVYFRKNPKAESNAVQ